MLSSDVTHTQMKDVFYIQGVIQLVAYLLKCSL